MPGDHRQFAPHSGADPAAVRGRVRRPLRVDPAAENPYLAALAVADAIVVTCDSVSMTSEAAATGKPCSLSR